MAITPSTTMVHLPLAPREAYGSPYPEGVAVGHIDAVGDATGGSVTASFLAQDQFLYRLEVVNATQAATEATNDASLALLSSWATRASGDGAGAYTLNWQMTQNKGQNFAVFVPTLESIPWMRRQILGDIIPGAGQFVAVITLDANTDTIVYDFDIMCSYWPKTALYLPGFLSAFYEAPEVAPPLP